MLNLFISFFKIGILGFGGGSAVAPLINKECVEKKKYITSDDFIDITAIANSLPGPSMSEIAVAIGYKHKGILGALVSVVAIILPMCFIFVLIYTFILKIVGIEDISVVVKPVLVIISAMMLSLSKTFYKKSSKEIKPVVILSISIPVAVLLIVFKLHPSIFIVSMALIVTVVTIMKRKVD